MKQNKKTVSLQQHFTSLFNSCNKGSVFLQNNKYNDVKETRLLLYYSDYQHFIVSRVIQADTLVPNNLLKQKIYLWL